MGRTEGIVAQTDLIATISAIVGSSLRCIEKMIAKHWPSAPGPIGTEARTWR